MTRASDGGQEHASKPRAAPPGTDREVALGSPAPPSAADARTAADTRELAALRDLLFGMERRQLEELRRRLDTFEVGPDEMAEQLPAAIAMRAARDGELARALTPIIESAIGESVRRNPEAVATAIYPALGPAIRKAIAARMAGPADAHSDRLTRFWWLIPVVLVVGLGAALLVRSNLRWSRAVERLEQEPGIVLVRAERGLGGWSFTGLRDPLAANPSVLLAAVGADTTSITARWEPYVSTQPPLVLERARRNLVAPTTVALTLAGDTLVARGQATRRWLDRAGTIAATLPGVAWADLSGVDAVASPEVEALRRAAAEHRVLFAHESASLDSTALAVVDSIVTSLNALREAAGAEGLALHLELVGRTDTTGSESTNLELARWRAVAVHDALLAAGVPATEMAVRAVGFADPLPADESLTGERINRSVSVVVAVR